MNKVDLIKKIKAQLSAIVESKYTMIKAGEMMLYTPDEELMIGSEVFLMDESNNAVDLTDDEYALDNGVVITVESGKVVSMTSTKEDVEMEETVEEVIEEKETELLVSIAELVNEKTGDEVSEVDSMDIAEDIIEKIMEIVEESSDMDEFKEKAFGIKKKMEETDEEKEEMVKEDKKEEELLSKFSQIISELETKLTKIEVKMSQISSEPSTDKITPKKVEFKSFEDKDNVSLDISSFRERLRKNR
jgi:hypothetical protein